MLEKLDKKKKLLDSMRPFSKEALQNLERWFQIELTYTSNAIEGNTLTRAETALVLEKGLTVGGKPLKDHIEAGNHLKALVKMKELAKTKLIKMSDIFSLHELILHGIDDENAGVMRSVNVRVSGSRVLFPDARKLARLLDDLEQWMAHSKTEHPVFRAAMAHYRLVTIHPFIDGNGRTARLLMNLILIQHGFPPAVIGPKIRLKYINSLEEAQLGGDLKHFLNLIYECVDHSLDIYRRAFSESPETKVLENTKLMRIGELSKKTGESLATLRYWVKMGLLEVAATTEAGYQLFTQDTPVRISKIRKLQDQRFSLGEILERLSKKNS